jgi:hypothetical protein
VGLKAISLDSKLALSELPASLGSLFAAGVLVLLVSLFELLVSLFELLVSLFELLVEEGLLEEAGLAAVLLAALVRSWMVARRATTGTRVNMADAGPVHLGAPD